MSKTGILFLIPTVIAENTVEKVLSPFVLEIISSLDEFIVEDERTARRFLKIAGYSRPINDAVLHKLDKHTDPADLHSFISSLLNGKNIGLLSEAGCPCIADPGSGIVEIAHQNNIKVKPLTGPSSILLALIASGFNGQNFAFNGYLPIEKNARIKKIKELENKSMRDDQTQIFMETPFRNMQLLNDILSSCRPSTRLCIAADITADSEFVETMSIEEWRLKIPSLNKRTVIFLLYK
jgi:16S rRNA (cytidine1402-2'-O)-methyltransferase